MPKVLKLSSKHKKKSNRLPVFHEYPQLGALAFKKGFTTITALARHIDRHPNSVTDALRREAVFPIVEHSIAEALGVSVARLRELTEPAETAIAA